MEKQKRSETYKETGIIQSRPLRGEQAQELVRAILGVGTDFSAIYVRGNKDGSKSQNAWYDTGKLEGIDDYDSVDAFVLVASGHTIYKGEEELKPEAFIPIAETMDLESRGPSENWSKRHWNNLRMLYNGEGYAIELVGIKRLKRQEDSSNPYMQGDFHMDLLRETLQRMQE
jgi:hypothetical protein